MKANGWLRLGSLLLVGMIGTLAAPASAQITVSSANPNSAPQGSTNLIVKIGGSGFKKGAQSAFYVTGTTNPGGITVNSTAFVSNSEVDANITVSSTATVSGFDISVTSGGRTGKGNDLFSVTSNPNANQGCVTQGPATGWTQVGVLNPVTSSGAPLYTGGGLGVAVRVQLVSVSGVPQFYAGLAGSGGGKQTIAFVLNLDGSVRRSWLVLSNYGANDIAVGDVNGDGAPDFVMGSPGLNAAHLFVGHVVTSATYGWDYNIDPNTDVISLPVPAGQPGGFGQKVAMGDLNGDGLDEIAVSAMPGKMTKSSPYGIVYIYTNGSSGWSMTKQLPDPGAAAADHYGSGLAVGELTTIDGSSTGTRLPDVAVAASDAGLVYVFQDPLGSVSGSGSLPTLSYSVGASNTIGSQAGIADVTGDGFPDLIGVVGSNNGNPSAQIFVGPLYQGEQPAYTLVPNYNLDASYGNGFDAADIDGDGKADVLVGAPNATYSSSCGSTLTEGVGYVYRTASGVFPNYSDLFEMPVVNEGGGLGHSMAAAPYNSVIGQSIILIGANLAAVGTQSGAGQVYIYRKTQ